MWPVLCLCLSSLTKASPKISFDKVNYSNKEIGLLSNFIGTTLLGLLLFTDKKRSTTSKPTSSTSSPLSTLLFTSALISLLFYSTRTLFSFSPKPIPTTKPPLLLLLVLLQLSSSLLLLLLLLLLLPFVQQLESIYNLLKSIGLIILRTFFVVLNCCTNQVLSPLIDHIRSHCQTKQLPKKEAHLNPTQPCWFEPELNQDFCTTSHALFLVC